MSPFYAPPNPAIVRELGVNERVLWSGQPDPSLIWNGAVREVVRSWFAEACAAFGAWDAGASLRATLSSGRALTTSDVFPAFIFAGGILGLILWMSSPWMKRAEAKRTLYVLTNRRALIIVKGSKRKVKNFFVHDYSLQVNDLRNGKGDLLFNRENKGSGRKKTRTEQGFYGIESAQEVERLARELAHGAR